MLISVLGVIVLTQHHELKQYTGINCKQVINSSIQNIYRITCAHSVAHQSQLQLKSIKVEAPSMQTFQT